MAEKVSSLKTNIIYKDTAIGKIPVDWEVVKLGDICDVIGGSTPSTKRKEYWEGEIPFATPTDITSLRDREISDTKQRITPEGLSSCGAHLLPGGSILLTSRATLGACAININPMATNQGFANLICNEKTYNWFIFYKMIALQRKLDRLGSGSTFKEVSKGNIKNLIIALPPPNEQKKIAEILATVDEAIEKTAQIIEKAKELKKGLMQKLLTRGISHNKFKMTEIGEIPVDWEVKRLIEAAAYEKYSFTGGPFGSNLKEDCYTERGVRIIQLQNIGDGKFLDDYKIFTSEEKADELRSCNIYPGDIIIAKTADPVARACIIPDTYNRYLMASDGIRLSINIKENDINFILYAINSPYFRKNAEIHSTGTTRLRIGLTGLRNLPIGIPPLKEQKKIADILSSIDDEIKKDSNHKEQLGIVKKGLMQVLLTGKIRVSG